MTELCDPKIFWVTAIFVALYLFVKYRVFNYWKKENVPHKTPIVPIGNMPISYFRGKICIGNVLKESYMNSKKHPYFGLYILHNPVLMINDIQLIQTILIKEFWNFTDRGWFSNESNDPLSSMMFLTGGDRWKSLRSKFSPTFTTGKLKQMYPLLQEISEELVKATERDLQKSNVIDVKTLLERNMVDNISNIVYGSNCNSLTNPNHDFRIYALEALVFNRLTALFAVFVPKILYKLNVRFFQKKIGDFFCSLFKEVVNYRNEMKSERKDFLNILIGLLDNSELDKPNNNVSSNNDSKLSSLNMNEAAAQAFSFFIAGYETSSSTSTYCLYELAMNPEIQEKLHEEIDEVAKSPEGFTYDSIMNMSYLDKVFYETTRKHPILGFLNRQCEADFPIPGTDYVIPKGMRLVISSAGIHHDPKYYPNPEIFDPERFSKENISTRPTYSYLAFGDGPRLCIGKRLALLQVKQALVTMLYNYKFTICEKTPVPVQYTTNSMLFSPATPVYLRAVKRIPS